jgi:hypothetical protein
MSETDKPMGPLERDRLLAQELMAAHLRERARLEADPGRHVIGRPPTTQRLVSRAHAALAAEAAQTRAGAAERLAIIEEARQRQAERDERHRRLAAQQPRERVTVDPDLVSGSPSGGWAQIAGRAWNQPASEPDRERFGDRRFDPDSSEEERRVLGGEPVAQAAPPDTTPPPSPRRGRID